MKENSQQGFTFTGVMIFFGLVAAAAAIAGTLYLQFFTTKDTTPPIISNVQPVGPLQAGTAAATISFDLDTEMPCELWDIEKPEVVYGMTASGPPKPAPMTHTATITGLSDDKTYTYIVRCMHMDSNLPDLSFIHVFNVLGNP